MDSGRAQPHSTFNIEHSTFNISLLKRRIEKRGVLITPLSEKAR
jgi:hypothetical protein